MCFFLRSHHAGSRGGPRTSRRSLKVAALGNNQVSVGHFSEANVQFHFKKGRKHFPRAELAIGLELNYSPQRLLSLLGKEYSQMTAGKVLQVTRMTALA